MKRLFTVILLLLISGAALANPVLPHPPSIDPPSTDVSVTFLSQIFGTVGDVLNGTSGSMMGHLFKIFNEGVLLVAGLWLGYTTTTVVIRSAQEGSFMGPNKNVAVILLRIALGVSLAIPSATTGYSMIQDIVMKTVVAGVGLADDTWDAALNYLKNGGDIYMPQQKGQHNSLSGLGASLGSINAKTNYAPVSELFGSLVCMMQSSNFQQQASQEENAAQSTGANSNSGAWLVGNNSSTYAYHMYEDPTNNTIYFPGYGNKANWQPGDAPAACGKIQGVMPPVNSNIPASEMQILKAHSYQATLQMVLDMKPAAERYNCMLNQGNADCTGVSSKDIYVENVKNTFNSYLGYYNLIQPYGRLLTQKVNSDAKKFIPNAKKMGWIMAGRFYWDMSRIGVAYNSINVAKDIPAMSGANTATFPAKLVQQIKQAKSDANAYAAEANSTDYMGKYLASQGLGESQESGASTSMGIDGIAGLIFHGLINNLLSPFNHPGSSPIAFLMSVGQACLQQVMKLWVAGLVLIPVLGALAGICNSTSPTGVVFSSALQWIKPMLIGIAAALVVPGVILSLYLPLYPYVLFTFASIGWLMLVLEAMVAAPLVAFGLTHPEGHDFLGKAEQAVMLFLGVFLRPVLMVIGMVAGMIVSYVAFKLLIYGFVGILGDVFGQASHTTLASTIVHVAQSEDGHGVSILGLIVLPALLIMFSMMVYTITQHCFSLIHSLHENIMRWIGAPQMQDPTSQLAKGIESSMGQGSRQGLEQVAGGTMGALQTTAQGTGELARSAGDGEGGGG